MATAARTRSPRLGLRARATLSFALLGLAVALAVAVSAWFLTRAHLVDEREAAAIRQIDADARLVRAGLRVPGADVPALLQSLGSDTGADLLIERRGERFAAGVQSVADQIPTSLQEVVRADGAGVQRFRDSSGELRLATGVALPAVDARFYGVVSLQELEDTLGAVRTSLVVGVIGATAIAALAGHRIAGRLFRPLAAVGDAARAIADGDLTARLRGPHDPDLRSLADAFDTMAERLERRIQRDIRFAADVSHELRSPLAAMTAAVEVIERRRGELSEQVGSAFDVLAERIRAFAASIEDLLEISRIDAGQAELLPEVLEVTQFCAAVLDARGLDGVEVRVPPGTTVVADRRRLAQVVGNLVDNAVRYAGGPTAIVAERGPDGCVRLAVEDAGPGVPVTERETIFDRFARGDAGVQAGAGSGSGLGLALVAEHVALHGGSVWVEDAAGGGARFVVQLPPAAAA